MVTAPEATPSTPTRWRAWRAGVARRPTLNLAYRIVVGVLGVVVLAVGILAIPYPGPGWLIVFAGLGILATEFAWAHRALLWTRRRYQWAMGWYAARGPLLRGLAAIATVALVLATLWLLGTFGMLGGVIGVEWEFLNSPLFR
ncbi:MULTISPECIES: TIGR02611 family protein [unclassified Nocardia]|uniref:TIGR02611 family protein n=1 Tax=unclassified Nocardia TaxID=2637762 RepID=UPI00278BBA4E|nr:MULTISPECIES: TIGR02611 family protein [unclassified Nocardia]